MAGVSTLAKEEITMTIQEFIEVAIEGGWEFGMTAMQNPGFQVHNFGFRFGIELKSNVSIDTIVLDPEAWQAVVRSHIKSREVKDIREQDIKDITQNWMHKMVDMLCSGKTLEEYIATL